MDNNNENIKHTNVENAMKRLYLKLKEEKSKEEILKNTVEEHKQTIEVLSKLTKKLNHTIMIPYSKFAFYEGQIKYTNNILQNMGYNVYCERTAENAEQFLKKKLTFYEQKLKIVLDSINKLTKEMELGLELNTNLNQNEDLSEGIYYKPDGSVEIREKYYSDDEEIENKKEIENKDKSNISSDNKFQTNLCEKNIKNDDTNIKRDDGNINKEKKQNKFIPKKKINSTSINMDDDGLINIVEKFDSENSS